MRARWLMPEGEPEEGPEAEDDVATDMEIGALIQSELASLRVARQVHRCQTILVLLNNKIL